MINKEKFLKIQLEEKNKYAREKYHI